MELQSQRKEKNIEGVRIIEMPHIVQCYNWDCGLACAQMVFKYLDKPFGEIYTKDLDYLQCGESVWTIDLAYLMKKHEISHEMYTITLGANEEYASKSYYSSHFSDDENRVNKLFQTAEENGVKVAKRSLSLDDIIKRLEEGVVAICLIDWTKLECRWCRSKILCLCCVDICCSIGGYQGHYIVLCGFDMKSRYIFYKNPNTNIEEMCCSSFSQFNKARTRFGTDEDILFVYKKDTDTIS